MDMVNKVVNNQLYNVYKINVCFRSSKDKEGSLLINFLIFQPKHMLWVLKRTVSLRQFF